jgi:hypothetical protein
MSPAEVSALLKVYGRGEAMIQGFATTCQEQKEIRMDAPLEVSFHPMGWQEESST